jgi:serine/threonine protein kinase
MPSPGDNYRSVLRLITKITGSVTEDDLWFVTNPNAKAYMTDKLPAYKKADLRALIPHAQVEALELLARMLEFDFAKRITVDEALAHPYFADIRDTEWEREASPDTFHWGDIDTIETTRLNMQVCRPT